VFDSRLEFFSKDRLALFNLTAHKLRELYYDRPTSYREALDRLRVRLSMHLLDRIIDWLSISY